MLLYIKGLKQLSYIQINGYVNISKNALFEPIFKMHYFNEFHLSGLIKMALGNADF